MATAKSVVVDGLTETDSGIRKLTGILRERNLTDDTSPYVSRALSRLEIVRPKIEEAKAFVASTKRRIDLDERSMNAELASAQLAISLFSSLVDLCEAAAKGSEAAPLRLIAVGANTLNAYLTKGPILMPNIYSVSDPQVNEAKMSLRLATANEMHLNVRSALDGVDAQLGIALPPCPQ